MSSFHSHIGELSRALIAIVKENEITENVYVEGYPSAVAEAPKDFAIITYPLTYRNKGPYQLHQVRLEIVAADMQNGRTDLLRIEEMANKWLDLFPINSGRFTLSSPYVRLKGSDGLGHHSWTIQCDCMVNTTDKYTATDDGTTATT